jgi:hypothetical protein
LLDYCVLSLDQRHRHGTIAVRRRHFATIWKGQKLIVFFSAFWTDPTDE